jgi:hypothetical protein
MENRLDISRLEKEAKQIIYANSEEILYRMQFIEDDGTVVYIEGDKKNGFIENRIPENSYFEIYKVYFSNGVLNYQGKIFGKETAIGIWNFYDENGTLTNTVNEDDKFGSFGYKAVLNFLIEKKYVDKDTYVGISSTKIVFSAKEILWYISITSPLYWVNEYEIDGDTGEIKKHNAYQGGEM